MNAQTIRRQVESLSFLNEFAKSNALIDAGKTLQKLGGPLNRDRMQFFLNDRDCLRMPATLVFSSEFAATTDEGDVQFIGEGKTRYCVMHIHPRYRFIPEAIPYVVADLASIVNFGPMASKELRLQYGAALMGLPKDAYAARLGAFRAASKDFAELGTTRYAYSS